MTKRTPVTLMEKINAHPEVKRLEELMDAKNAEIKASAEYKKLEEQRQALLVERDKLFQQKEDILTSARDSFLVESTAYASPHFSRQYGESCNFTGKTYNALFDTLKKSKLRNADIEGVVYALIKKKEDELGLKRVEQEVDAILVKVEGIEQLQHELMRPCHVLHNSFCTAREKAEKDIRAVIEGVDNIEHERTRVKDPNVINEIYERIMKLDADDAIKEKNEEEGD